MPEAAKCVIVEPDPSKRAVHQMVEADALDDEGRTLGDEAFLSIKAQCPFACIAPNKVSLQLV